MSRSGKKSVAMLVWILVMTGLISIVITNSIIGWAISDLNQEQQQLLRLDSQLSQTSQKLKRLNLLAQSHAHELLQRIPMEKVNPFPSKDFALLLDDLKQNDNSPEMNVLVDRLSGVIERLRALWEKAGAWRDLQQQIVFDQQHKNTLSLVRGNLNKLHDNLEILEGRQRLKEALLIRKWYASHDNAASDYAETFLHSQSSVGKRVLGEIKMELMDLARRVEILAGENQPGQLANLKDNQIKPNLERIGQLLAILYNEKILDPELMPPTVIEELQQSLFGVGYTVYKEYQTIRPGVGGLYQLTSS